MTPKEYFEQKVPENLKNRAEKISSINSIYEFNLSGNNGGVWTLDLTVPGGKVSEGSSGKAHCTITMDADNFVKLVTGQMNAQLAFMTGKLKVAGNMGLALKLQNVL